MFPYCFSTLYWCKYYIFDIVESRTSFCTQQHCMCQHRGKIQQNIERWCTHEWLTGKEKEAPHLHCMYLSHCFLDMFTHIHTCTQTPQESFLVIFLITKAIPSPVPHRLVTAIKSTMPIKRPCSNYYCWSYHSRVIEMLMASHIPTYGLYYFKPESMSTDPPRCCWFMLWRQLLKTSHSCVFSECGTYLYLHWGKSERGRANRGGGAGCVYLQGPPWSMSSCVSPLCSFFLFLHILKVLLSYTQIITKQRASP